MHRLMDKTEERRKRGGACPQVEYLGYFCTILDKLITQMDRRIWAISQLNFSPIRCVKIQKKLKCAKNLELYGMFQHLSFSWNFHT